jgi:hypothetical protein
MLEGVEPFFDRKHPVVERIDRAQPASGPTKPVLHAVDYPDSCSTREIYDRSGQVLTRASETRNDVAFLRPPRSRHAGTIAVRRVLFWHGFW